ncbi:MAG TPA: hypothetical protein VL588_00295, partial [Bdellovibrionota bacterium]|nr:hypothetical protein [Bdellovibrionota bacterium]
PETRAYIRGEGFLGDKFVELKPVKYTGPKPVRDARNGHLRIIPIPPPVALALWPASGAWAAKTTKNKDIPVGESKEDMQEMVGKVDELVTEMRSLTTNLKQSINPDELRQTIQQLNQVLSNASKTLSPQGGLTSTAQRAVAKLEDSIEQLRDMFTRVNQGEGSIGMLLNDRKYADEVEEALINLNRLLSKVRGVRFVVDAGASEILAFNNGGRAWFKVGIWPQRDRYYLLGVALDPRGKVTSTDTTTVVASSQTTVRTIQTEPGGVLFTGMLGKVFWNRLDLSIGLLNGDGTFSMKLGLWKNGYEDKLQISADVYAVPNGLTGKYEYNVRPEITIRPVSTIYLRGGLETLRQVNGQTAWSYGAGISFDDEDIKLLFTLL